MNGDGNQFACGAEETCHIVMNAATPATCLTPPCYARAFCVNSSQPDPDVAARALFLPIPIPHSVPGCRPNAARLTNRCARLLLSVSRSRIPYGVSLDDVCSAVRSLSIVTTRLSHEGGLVGMSCGLNSVQPSATEPNEIATIEVNANTNFKCSLLSSLLYF